MEPKQTIREDPIVAEVRAAREKLLADCGGTLEKLFEFLKKEQQKPGKTLVAFPPRSTSRAAMQRRKKK